MHVVHARVCVSACAGGVHVCVGACAYLCVHLKGRLTGGQHAYSYINILHLTGV